MYSIARLSEQEKRILFRNTAQKSGLIEAIVEKDFWVCIMLDYLFHRCQWKNSFTFKGGTSLSKCYGLINRFSEDIDLILDWRVMASMNPGKTGATRNRTTLTKKQTPAQRFGLLKFFFLRCVRIGPTSWIPLRTSLLSLTTRKPFASVTPAFTRLILFCRCSVWRSEHLLHGRRP